MARRFSKTVRGDGDGLFVTHNHLRYRPVGETLTGFDPGDPVWMSSPASAGQYAGDSRRVLTRVVVSNRGGDPGNCVEEWFEQVGLTYLSAAERAKLDREVERRRRVDPPPPDLTRLVEAAPRPRRTPKRKGS